MNEDKDQTARAPANDVGDAAVGEFPDEGAATVSPEERVEALEQELAEAKDRLLRALAETENVRRRAQREREDTLKYAISNFARDLLSPVDNLRRALDSVKEAEIDDPRAKSLLDGVAATEFSIGIIAKAARPSRTAAKASSKAAQGRVDMAGNTRRQARSE